MFSGLNSTQRLFAYFRSVHLIRKNIDSSIVVNVLIIQLTAWINATLDPPEGVLKWQSNEAGTAYKLWRTSRAIY